MNKSRIGAWATALLLAAASLIPVGQAEAKTVPLEYEVVINVQSGARDYGTVVYGIEGTGKTFVLTPGDTGSIMVPKGKKLEYTVQPDRGGRVDFVKKDGALIYYTKQENDLVQSRKFEIPAIQRIHRVDIGFTAKDDSIGGVPDEIGTEADSPFLVGMAWKMTPRPAYAQWVYDANYVKVYDLRDKGNSDGGIWIRALMPGSTTPVCGWSASTWNRGIDVKVGANTTGKHYIFALAGTHGQIDTPGNQEVKPGESKTFTIMPDVGYWIDTLTVDDQPVTLTDEQKKGNYQYTFSNVNRPHNLVAIFKEAEELVMPTGSLEGYVGETLLNVKPNPNYGAWIYDDEYVDCLRRLEGADWVYDFTFKKENPSMTMTYEVNGMKQDVQLKINASNLIAASADPGGTISPEGDVYVRDSAGKTFTIVPNENYAIGKVFVDNVDKTAELMNNTYTFTNVQADRTIRATFVEITGIEDKAMFVGDSVSMIPSPAGGKWKVADPSILSISEQGGTATFTAEKAGTTTVSYAVNGGTCEATITVGPVHTIKASAEMGGTISPTGDVYVRDNAGQTFTITPNENYAIGKVFVDNADKRAELVNNTYTFTNVQADCTIRATFVEIMGIEDKVMFVGDSVDMVPLPAGGKWKVADPSILSITEQGGTVTFTAEKAGTTTVSYAVNGGMCEVTVTVRSVHTIKASAETGGTISPTGDVYVRDNAGQTFTITPNENYAIGKVFVDNADKRAELVNNTYTFTNVQADRTIRATFVEITGIEDKVMFIGDSVDMIPSPAGGKWKVTDPSILSISERGGTVTFTAEKAGTTTVSYAVNGGTCEATVTVRTVHTVSASDNPVHTVSASDNPDTGDSGYASYLIGLALAGGSLLLLARKKKTL